jgi:hypothetical protein
MLSRFSTECGAYSTFRNVIGPRVTSPFFVAFIEVPFAQVMFHVPGMVRFSTSSLKIDIVVPESEFILIVSKCTVLFVDSVFADASGSW